MITCVSLKTTASFPSHWWFEANEAFVRPVRNKTSFTSRKPTAAGASETCSPWFFDDGP